MSDLVVQEFDSFDRLAGLRTEWDAVVTREGLSPAHEFDWLATLWKLRGQGRQVLLLVIRDTQRVVGFAPFVKETERRKGVKVQLLKPLGLFHQLHGTQMILAERKQEALEAVFDHLARYHDGWVLWPMAFLLGEEQETIFKSLLREHEYPFTVYAGDRSPYLLIDGSWEDKMKKLQPRFRTALRSRERRLREKGRLEFRFLGGASDWQQGLEAIREIEEQSWKSGAGTAITVQQFQWRFYSSYAPIAASAGTLRIPVLYFDGEPLAYDYALYRNGVYSLLKTSFQQSWEQAYPGFILRKLVIEWLYTNQGREFDFLGKDEEWKMKWTDTVREHILYHSFNRHLRARYLFGIHCMKRFLQGAR